MWKKLSQCTGRQRQGALFCAGLGTDDLFIGLVDLKIPDQWRGLNDNARSALQRLDV
jgi:hypothetical protein